MSNKIIDLKGSILSLTVLKLYANDFAATKAALAQKIAQAPDFFVGIPIVLEPQISELDPMFLAQVVEYCHQLQMIPIGIRTENEAIKQQAEYAGLAIFPLENKRTKKPETLEQSDVAESKVAESNTKNVLDEATPTTHTAMTVSGSVRSGQQIYAKGRDLIVMGSINPGAEVVADGNVFVFGKVMGKVFAGSSGLQTARIFAKQLKPELICIAGMYQLAEDIDPAYQTGFVEVSLQQEKLIFNNKILD